MTTVYVKLILLIAKIRLDTFINADRRKCVQAAYEHYPNVIFFKSILWELNRKESNL